MTKRRTHSPELKARVANEAISGRKTIQEIAADHAIHPIQVSQWKRQLLDGASEQLLGGLELADDLLRGVPGAFHGEVPGPVWPAEDSHSPWTAFQGPCHGQPGIDATFIAALGDLGLYQINRRLLRNKELLLI